MIKFVSKVSATMGGMRLKSVVVVPKRSHSSKVIDEKDHFDELVRLKTVPQTKRKLQSSASNDNDNDDRHKSDACDKQSKRKRNWPSTESLIRHANFRPLGVTDDWGPLSHKHELMPTDNVRYWHQHRCEVCDKLFEHKHKQRGDQSMNYNKHICNVCGGTQGSRRVLFKNSQPSIGYRKNR